MKGLLLKDWYMMTKYCRSYLLIAVVFIAVSLFNNENLFMVFYPCLLCGVIPVNLLSYDERSGFLPYSLTLPYTKTQIVSAKYLIGLLAQLAMLTVTVAAQGIAMYMRGAFSVQVLVTLTLMLLFTSTVSSSISLPFIFKMGVEKGRMVYYVTIGVICAFSVLGSKLFQSIGTLPVDTNLLLPVLCLVGIGLYALSWRLAIVFFKKREL